LVIAPYVAVASARGAAILWERSGPGGDRRPVAEGVGLGPIRIALAAVLSVALLTNCGWLIYAAETIADRHTDRFIHEAARYIAASGTDRRFFVSPRVRLQLASLGPLPSPGVTDDPARADYVVFYANEGLPRWQDWPANQPWLTTWFGPCEVNFNIYPNWWGDDRIVVMPMRQARALRLLPLQGAGGGTTSSRVDGRLPTIGLLAAWVACLADGALSWDSAPPPSSDVARSSPARPSTGSRWKPPDLDPCDLLLRTEVESVVGSIKEGPRSGGLALDGTSCTYIVNENLIVNLGLISAEAFELVRSEPELISLPSLGDQAYLVRPNSFDMNLFVRKGRDALVMRLTANAGVPESTRLRIATQLAAKGLERLAAR
jgi:hypothetical protein